MLKRRYTRPITITLEEEVFERIKAITDREELSLSQWIRAAIKEFLVDEDAVSTQKDSRGI